MLTLFLLALGATSQHSIKAVQDTSSTSLRLSGLIGCRILGTSFRGNCIMAGLKLAANFL